MKNEYINLNIKLNFDKRNKNQNKTNKKKKKLNNVYYLIIDNDDYDNEVCGN